MNSNCLVPRVELNEWSHCGALDVCSELNPGFRRLQRLWKGSLRQERLAIKPALCKSEQLYLFP